MFARMFFVVLALRICCAECIQVETRTATIEVTAFDNRGVQLEGAEAELLDVKSLKRISRATRGRFDRVLYGEYRVKVWAQGFNSIEVPVRVEQSGLAVRVQLSVGMECRTFSSLVGLVVSAKPSQGLWVKLVPVYGSGGVETPVGATGSFLASGLDPGPYLILVMDGTTVLHSEALTIRGWPLVQNIRIDLKSGPQAR